MSVHSSHAPLAPNITRRAVRYTVNNVTKIGYLVTAEIYIDNSIQTILEYIEEVDGSIIVDISVVDFEYVVDIQGGDVTNNDNSVSEVWNTTIYEGDRVRLVRTVDNRVLWAVYTVNDAGDFTVRYFDSFNNEVFNVEIDLDSVTNINNNQSNATTTSLWFEQDNTWLEFFEINVVQIDGRIAYTSYIDIDSQTVVIGDRIIYREPEYRTVSGQVMIRNGQEWSSRSIEVVGEPITGISVTGLGFNLTNSFTIELEEGQPIAWTEGQYNESYNTEGNGTRFTGLVKLSAIGKGYAKAIWRRRKPLRTRKYVKADEVSTVTSQSFT